MEQNRFAHGTHAPASADEPAALPHWPGVSWATAPDVADPLDNAHEFAGEAHATAYWQGVADGIRKSGGIVPPRLAARLAREEAGLLVPAADPDDILAFDPVPLRPRADGLSPDKQRAFVEALADTGIARVAAARIGVSEQAIARARRRAGARSFDLACEAARRIGARRLHDLAWERAMLGTVKQHFYHGELKGEERIFDNRLLTYLLGRTAHLAEPPRAAHAVAANWDRHMEELEHGPPPPPEAEPFDGSEVFDLDDEVWTSFPPPADFDGEEHGEWGDSDYRRSLTAAEAAVIEADEAADRGQAIAEHAARRDLYFGFDDDPDEEKISPSMEAETYETSASASAARMVPDEPGEAETRNATPPSPAAAPPPAP